MTLVPAIVYDIPVINSWLEKYDLEIGHVPICVARNRFFVNKVEENGILKIIDGGCYDDCDFKNAPNAYEIRSVFIKPRSGLIQGRATKSLLEFIIQKARKDNGKEVFALIDPNKKGMKTYIEFLRRFVGFSDEKDRIVPAILPRYVNAKHEEYDGKVFLSRLL